MRKEMIMAVAILSVYLLLVRFTNTSNLILGILLFSGLFVSLLAILPIKYYRKYEKWRKSFTKKKK